MVCSTLAGTSDTSFEGVTCLAVTIIDNLNSRLKAIANAKAEPSQHERHVELLEKNQEGSLVPEERQELTDLRLAADRLMLCKAYAWSVLRWRGHRIPPLKVLPASL